MLSITSTKDPADCVDMTEVRAGVDAVDAEIVKLLGRRFAYMDAAARIKTDRATVRDEARKTQVLDNAEQGAVTEGIPAGFIRKWWEQLVEASISHELQVWDDRRR
ncbi:MAG TPA: chorismate mutase [Sphingorhabdus sp.]|jgi:isochorismate pyruvate lyase|nr:chorismate mutase [Sphingorhabdus sp.]